MLPEPECRLGYTHSQLKLILGDRFHDFGHWMHGQTMAICEGKSYSHETKQYREACGGVSHGVVIYCWDLERYLAGLPVID